MITIAATAGIQGGQILGTLGASGAALAVTVILVLGVKGKKKLKFDQMQAAIVGLIAGTLYATAASIWSTPGNVTAGLAQAIQGGVGGNVGMGAIAVCIVAIIYGANLKPRTSAFLGIAAASVFAAAGGLWALVSTVLASGLNQVLGVA
ncbi:hypothetical protein ACFXKG_40365 [Streptomyces sp. NPDC059255]|uniref:hypothetical protein n=1 Tax=Streptomyces sp. NPDC059255 TaxID=3346793 RepID=UPI0036AC445B